jgi:hypothetical protein
MRVSAIHALEQLDAKEALPQLHALLHDASAYFYISVPVADEAQKAIDRLEHQP